MVSPQTTHQTVQIRGVTPYYYVAQSYDVVAERDIPSSSTAAPSIRIYASGAGSSGQTGGSSNRNPTNRNPNSRTGYRYYNTQYNPSSSGTGNYPRTRYYPDSRYNPNAPNSRTVYTSTRLQPNYPDDTQYTSGYGYSYRPGIRRPSVRQTTNYLRNRGIMSNDLVRLFLL